MNKNYQLLEEFSFIKDRCPKGIYLIPVPPTISQNSNRKSSDTQSDDPEGWGNSLPNGYLKDLAIYSQVEPWQGVLFVRNPKSPYFGGVFRFEIAFLKYKQIEKWMQQASGTANLKTYRNTPFSYNNYPIICMTSELHHLSNEQDRIAEYCLNGIWNKEQKYVHQETPFSRVLYSLEKLVEWFDGVDTNPQQAHLARVDTQLSTSDTLLYHTLKNSDNERQGSSSTARLINFVQTTQPLRHDVLDLVTSSKKGN